MGALLAVAAISPVLFDASFAAAADPDVVREPEWSVGDWWELSDRPDGPTFRLTVLGREHGQYVLARTRSGQAASTLQGHTSVYADPDGWATKVIDQNGKVTETGDKRQWVKFPLAIGKRWFFNARSKTVQGDPTSFAYDCQAQVWETIPLGGTNIRALKILCSSQNAASTWGTNTHNVWYVPEVKRVVRVVSHYRGGPTLEMSRWHVEDRQQPPLLASPAPPSPAPAVPPPVAVAPPPPRRVVPPTLLLLDPKAGSIVRTPDVLLKVEVLSPYRVAVVVGTDDGREVGTFRAAEGAKPGESWLLAAPINLVEGDNKIRLEAVDEHGTRVSETITLTRQSFVTIELRGPPGARIQVDQDRYILDAQGAVTIELPPGSHEVEASKEGYAPSPLRERLTLRPGQPKTRHDLALAPVPAPPQQGATAPRDTDPPKITINYPPADAKLDREQIVVLGVVTDDVGVDRVQMTLNGVQLTVPRAGDVGERGRAIRVTTRLQPGDNVIEITASDKAGNVAQVVRTVTRVVPQPVTPLVKTANRYAVVIGIGNYASPSIPRLRFATRDAEAMYRFLTTKGGYPKDNVLLLTDAAGEKPTLQNIRKALGEFLYRKPGREDMVLIYYAGHGAPEVDTAGNETDGLAKYLIPMDAEPESLYSTALPMDEIQRIFARIPAERIVMLLDTCYSGTAGGRTFMRQQIRAGGINDQFLERLTRSKGRVIITASGPNEVALESSELGHGVFTYFLLQGLAGQADRNGDGVVTVSELYEYVEEQVDRKARAEGGRQRPLMKGEVEGTLPLVRVAK